MIRDAPSSIHVLRFDGSRRAMILALAWSEDFHSSSIAWSWKIISLKELAILRRRKAASTCPGTSSHTRQYCSGRRMLRFISRSNRGDNTAIKESRSIITGESQRGNVCSDVRQSVHSLKAGTVTARARNDWLLHVFFRSQKYSHLSTSSLFVISTNMDINS